MTLQEILEAKDFIAFVQEHFNKHKDDTLWSIAEDLFELLRRKED